MNLIKYDNRINRRRVDEIDKPMLRIGPYSIVLLGRLIELLDVKCGDHVSLFQSSENEHDWYIAKDPEGLRLHSGVGKRETKNTRLHITSSKLCKQLGDLYGEGAIIEVGRGITTLGELELHLLITAPIVAERRLANLTKPKGNG